ncbi:MAG: hypothetical protein QF410_11105 [Planctomycetota bacterium]|nr:hypothetical protein [Planctomycetota bacterium]
MAWIAPLIVFALLGAPALRLVRLPAEARGPADRAIAWFFLSTAAGISLRLVAVAGGGASSGEAMALNALGHLCLSLACVALFVFTREVFRPTEVWARNVLWGGTLGTFATFAMLFGDGGVSNEGATSVLLANAFRTVSYLWCFVESRRYGQLMRRRLALGLADPVVANRFSLWAVWTGGLCSALGVVLVLRVLGRIVGVGADALPLFLAPLRLALLLIVSVSVAAIWLSFFPPAAYQRWLRARAS